MYNTRFFALLGITLSAAAMRLLPHPTNVTPIAAMALLGGVYFTNRKIAFLIPLAAMYLSDLALGFFVYNFGWFHRFMPFVYAGFLVNVCLGRFIRRRFTPLSVGGAALAGPVLFFIITNFGVWLCSNLYPKTFAGLLSCYIAGLSFFRNALVGDTCYTLLLFGGFALAQRYLPVLREEPVIIPAQKW